MKTLAALSLVGAVGLASTAAFAQSANAPQQPATVDIRVDPADPPAAEPAPQPPAPQAPVPQPAPAIDPAQAQAPQPQPQQPGYGVDPNAGPPAQPQPPGGYYAQPQPQQPGGYYAQPQPQLPTDGSQGSCVDAATGAPVDINVCMQILRQQQQPQGAYAQPQAYAAQPATDPDASMDDGYDPQAYQQFESQLAPYGSWTDVAPYGHVWIPSAQNVGADFSPYASGGHWAQTEYGWTWVSDYDWGWAPFHYGRWVSAENVGWCWVPGTTWGPAWVSWRQGGDYVGWAPLPPAGMALAPATMWNSPWRFTSAGQLGALRPGFLPRTAYPVAWGATAVVANTRTVNINGVGVPVNAGPQLGPRAGVPVMPLGRIAPMAVPRPGIMPRMGMPLASRPWMAGRVGVPGAYGGYNAQPGFQGQRPTWSGPAAPRPYWAPQNGYARPGWSAPVQPNYGRPAWSAPVQPNYARPAYSAPSYRTWSAPARPSYSAPSYHPSFGGGGFGGGWHGGGGGFSGGFGGRRRR